MEGHQHPGDIAIFGVGKPLIVIYVIFQAFCIEFLVGFAKAKVGSGGVRIILYGERKSLTSSARHISEVYPILGLEFNEKEARKRARAMVLEVGNSLRGGQWSQRWAMVLEVGNGLRGGQWSQRWAMVSEVVLKEGDGFKQCYHWCVAIWFFIQNYYCVIKRKRIRRRAVVIAILIESAGRL